MTKDTDKTSNKESALEGIIDRLEETRAVIKTKDGQKVIWPIKDLPNDTGEGEAVKLVLSTDKTKTSEQEDIAKTILNEMLKTND